MDPNANLKEQAELLHMQRHSLVQTRAQRAQRMERLQELREALRDWIRGQGFEPTWADHPFAAKTFKRWLHFTRRFGRRLGGYRPEPDISAEPCYIIDDGARGGSLVSYKDGWCYGPDRVLGRVIDNEEEARDIIARDIREAFDERNGLPVFRVSDHGNVMQVRRVTLRSRELKR